MITKTNVHLNSNNKIKQRWVKNLDIANFLFHVKVNIHRTVLLEICGIGITLRFLASNKLCT